MIGDFIKTNRGTYRHLALEEVSSTNSLALEYALSGEAGNLWITAESQTSGRGSRGRSWQSQTGNLLASLLLTNPGEQAALSQLTFVASISVLEAIETFNVNGSEIKVKWPNDVLINSRKCSGILLESVRYQDVTNVVVGIGVNCESFPVETLHPATSLHAEGIEVSKNRFFLMLANIISDNISVWNKGEGFSAIRGKWLEKAFGLGRKTTVKVPAKETVEGTFEGIDLDGFMLLRTDTEIIRISTADIFFNS